MVFSIQPLQNELQESVNSPYNSQIEAMEVH